MLNKKKVLATTLGAVFALSALGSAFAAETTTKTQASVQIEKHFDGGKHIGKKGPKLEEIAKEKGITVDELKAQKEKERAAKLEELAKEKGLTVEELKAEMAQNHRKGLGQFAKTKQDRQAQLEKGVTVDELKAQMVQEREVKQQARLEKLSAKKGVTVEALKAEMEQKRETRLAAWAKEKGITVDELKAQFGQDGHGFRGLK